jgi:hypothetical protein
VEGAASSWLGVGLRCVRSLDAEIEFRDSDILMLFSEVSLVFWELIGAIFGVVVDQTDTGKKLEYLYDGVSSVLRLVDSQADQNG